ncbi:hypothetical protein PHMEG_00028585 [Phytophthora megakarya]|uniref:Uncharacterized protein n=1 Tax=Phytophthora megakarya TaxID=4795 RepID=A0A225V570_9STRA|nr:hypothetical protein PHMEG_00028585 [Phytophthora megakarya]
MGEEPGAQDPPGSEDVELKGVSGSGPRISADGLRQVRPAVYDPQTDPKGVFYRPIDSDADPVRPVEELAQVLTRSKVDDVRMDVLEYWQMDTDRCTLTEAEDAIQGRTTEDIVVHVSLRKHILVEFLRRALILSFLDEVLWFQHVPEEFFDRALAEAEDDAWELGVAEGVNPLPSVPLQPRDSPSLSEEEEEASGNERDGNEPGDETSLGKRSRPKSKTPAGKRSKRLAPPTPSPGKSSSSRTPRERTAPALSDVSSDDENPPPRRVKTLPWTPEMGYERYHTDTRLVKSWVIYNTRVRRTSTRLKHQNPGLPDDEVMSDEVHSVAERVPVAEYRDIVESQAPWDDMFDEHVRVLLFVRDKLSPEFTGIAKRYVLFMWVWRREEWERTHWIVLNRNVEAHVATLPPPKEERIAASVSPAVWGTRVTAYRFPVPEPEEYVMPSGRR